MVPDDEYLKRLEKLYKLAKSHGFSMPNFYEGKPENQQYPGMKIAIAQMVDAIGAGKLKVTK